MRQHRKDTYKLFLIPLAALLLAALCWPAVRYFNRLFGRTAGSALLILVAAFGALTLLSYVLPVGRLRSFLRWCGAFFYPLFLTALLPLLALDIAYYVFRVRLEPKTALLLLFGAFLILALAGLIAGSRLRTRRYTAFIKGASPCRIVLVSDLHLGSFTPARFGDELRNAVLKARPDAVVIAGDLFDDRFESLSQRKARHIYPPLCFLSVDVPLYACEGNHDILYEDERKDAFIKACGIQLLRDECLEIHGIRFLFRRDAEDPDRAPDSEVFPPEAMPAVVVDHVPFLYKEAWSSGASLVLSGHTHAGQTFPATLLFKTFRSHGYGLSREGDKQLIVTSGAGFCGCPIRLGAAREIAVIDIRPE